jgi:hypothetical protein
MKKIFLCLAFLLLIPVLLSAAEPPKHSYKPPQGYVPNEATAIRIAEAVLTPIYGVDTIEKEKPLIARLENETWVVEGTFRCPGGSGCKGGVAVAEIAKDDGKILRVSHGK